MLDVLLVVLLVLALVVGAVRLLAWLNQAGRQTPAKDWQREYIAEITAADPLKAQVFRKTYGIDPRDMLALGQLTIVDATNAIKNLKALDKLGQQHVQDFTAERQRRDQLFAQLSEEERAEIEGHVDDDEWLTELDAVLSDEQHKGNRQDT